LLASQARWPRWSHRPDHPLSPELRDDLAYDVDHELVLGGDPLRDAPIDLSQCGRQNVIVINYGIAIPKILGASEWSAEVLTTEQIKYAALDAVMCSLLWLTQQTELFDDIDKQCQELADATVPAVARMELHGMPIDIDAHRKQIAHWKADLIAAEAALRAASPLRDIQWPSELQQHLMDVLDDCDLAEWPRTPNGKLTTRRLQLQLNADLPAINELLKVRVLRKMIEAFGDSLITAVNPVTGRLHTSFMIAGASTGRFSARSPNLRQMPKGRQKDFRCIFAAPAGRLVMALDYSQIELRVATELISDWFGTDSVLRQAFAAGLDAHTATALAMTGTDRPGDGTPEERQMAKPCNFGLLYRMGDRGFYNYLRAGFQPDITYAEACDLRARFFECYPDMARWQDEYARQSRQQVYTQTVVGRRWRWGWEAHEPEELDEDAPFYADKLIGFHGAYAVNHPVQGSCAEVMMIALTRLDKALRDEPAQLIATVHDEVVLLVSDNLEAVERISTIADQEMVAALLEVFPRASISGVVAPAVGPDWGDLKPLSAWVKERRLA
jgi:DNA polymerase-1